MLLVLFLSDNVHVMPTMKKDGESANQTQGKKGLINMNLQFRKKSYTNLQNIRQQLYPTVTA